MAEESTFTAFRLPDDVLLRIARCMDYFELISLSLASQRSKKLVKSLNLPCLEMDLDFKDMSVTVYPKTNSDYVEFSFHREDNNWTRWDQYPTKVAIVKSLNGEEELDVVGIDDDVGNENENEDMDDSEADGESGNATEDEDESAAENEDDVDDLEEDADDEIKWTNQGLTLQQWVHHLCSVFHNSTPLKIILVTDHRTFSVQSIRDNVPKHNILSICSLSNTVDEEGAEYARNALEMFAGIVENLYLAVDPLFNEWYSFQRFAIHNFRVIILSNQKKLTLDNLLCLNARRIFINRDSNFAVTDLNRFIKRWIRGSNPRMSSITVRYSLNVVSDINIALRGIQYTLESDDVVRMIDEDEDDHISYIRSMTRENLGLIQGGFDIESLSGRTATVYGLNHLGVNAVSLYVWK